MVKTLNLGKVGITTAGDYNYSKSYDRLTAVIFRGSGWVSRKNVPSGVDPTYSEYWQKLAERGEQGVQGIQGPAGPQGNSAFDGSGVEIVNNLTQGGESAVLSAEQGKILKEELSELQTTVEDLTDFGLVLDGGRADTKYASLPVIDGGKANF
jgi:hypothetical protein